MKIAMVITCILGCVLTVLGCIPYAKAQNNENAEAASKAKRWFGVASLFLTAFVILLAVELVRLIFSVLG